MSIREALKRKFEELSDSEISNVLEECNDDVLEAFPTLQKLEHEKLKKLLGELRNENKRLRNENKEIRNKFLTSNEEKEVAFRGLGSSETLKTSVKKNEQESRGKEKESCDEDPPAKESSDEEIPAKESSDEELNLTKSYLGEIHTINL